MNAKAYLYTRISTLQQVAGFGIERQQSTVLDFLNYASLPKDLGLTISADNYEMLEPDLGRSAFKGDNFKRGNLGLFKQRVENNEIETPAILVIEDVDRFSRLPGFSAIEEFTFFINRDISIYEVRTGQVFSKRLKDSGITRLSNSIERAYQESERKSFMAKKSWANRRNKLLEDGQALVTHCPRWLLIEDGRYVSTELVHTFKLMFEMYAEGHGITSILRKLNTAGLTDNGKNWSTVTVHRALRDQRLIGKHTVLNGEVINAYPVVIDAVLFNRVQKIMSSKSVDNTRRTTKHQRNLFNGISRCTMCGEAMIADKNGHGNLFMVCLGRRHKKGCGQPNMPYGVIEEELLNHANGLTFEESTPVNSDVINRIRELESDIEDHEAELKTAGDDEVLALVRVLKKLKAQRLELQADVNAVTLQASNVVFDTELLKDQERVAERQNANVMIKKVIKRIDFNRVGDTIQLEITYHTPHIRHTLLLSARERKLLAVCSIDNDGVIDMGYMKVDMLNNNVEMLRQPTDAEVQIAREYLKFINEGFVLALNAVDDENDTLTALLDELSKQVEVLQSTFEAGGEIEQELYKVGETISTLNPIVLKSNVVLSVQRFQILCETVQVIEQGNKALLAIDF